ncbi:MAG: phosphopantothenoylcysteine decarboxylase [Planctomycetales bacterium]|nr:phosphopantothenoylcysteine decarboxylase [Planctomycetales bacterium]
MTPCRLVVGVTGGIAAFKSAALVSQLVQGGADVTVVMTAAAGQFVGEATFAALTGHAVATNLFDPGYPLGAHIELAQRAELLCIAPCSADFMRKMATGAADDLLSTLYLCFAGPVLIAPAMNDQMWLQPAVQRNVAQLRSDGVHFVEPQAGWLSCRQTGVGRMAEPTQILKAIESMSEARG